MAIQKRTKARLMDTAAFPCAPQTGRAAERQEAWFRSAAHLAWIRTQPCACGSFHAATEPVEAAHVRSKTDGCAGEKPSDIFVLPLNVFCHRIQHSMSEAAYWQQRGVIDPAGLALSYALKSPCERTRKAALNVLAGKPWSAS